MLVRITHGSSGIEHYFEEGKKAGREATRDEMDVRVHLSGDLTAFSTAVKYSQAHKDWKNNYWHITDSFALENNDISAETMREIVREQLEYYFPNSDPDKLIHAAEAHLPKLQSSVNKTTGEEVQRLTHLHLAVAKYDPETGNQVRMTIFNQKADQAFQSYLCLKHGLVDPKNRKREISITKKDIIARWKGDGVEVSKQTNVADLRKLFSDLVNDAASLDEARDLILETGMAEGVELKIQKSGNRYLQVKTPTGSRNINLRGKGFEDLEKLYYSDQEMADRADQGKYQGADDRSRDEQLADYKKIWTGHKDWYVEEERKRVLDTKLEPKPDHKKTEEKYQSVYERYTREQRNYFVIYRTNIQEEAVRGFKVFEKNNERHLVNNDIGVTIYDRPESINLKIPNDAEKRTRGIHLALLIATDKGWNLETMEINGSAEFQSEVRRQVADLKAQKELVKAPVSEAVQMPDPEPKRPLSAVTQAVVDEEEASAKRLAKNDIANIKLGLDAATVINYAVNKYGLMGQHFTVTSDNKIKDDRTRAKPKNVIDFITKTCNVGITDALPALQDLYQQQQTKEAAPTMDISICTSSNPNGLGGWVHKQPKTFTELASLVKSYPYAGFSELTDNYRTANNIAALGRCAIFDIDNDPGKPQLNIQQAQELLKSTTYMLVTSKSHQIDKLKPSGEPLPAVDRYRIIVPLTESLSAHKDLYRAGMMQLAEQIGLDQYADPKALKDVARQYYKSPADAQVIINNTKQAFNAEPINIFATEEVQRLATEKASARAAVLNRSKVERSEFNADQSAYPKVINLDAMNQLPLDEIYESLTGNALTEEGSYLMGPGVTSGTSKSRESFTVFDSDGQWLWHDFKTSESGNVVTFMRAMGYDVFKASQMLSKHFSVDLLTDNPSYYENVLKEALRSSGNDKELQDSIKSATGARFVRIEKDSIKIADKEFSFLDLNTTKSDVISQLRKNRDNNIKPGI